MGASLSRRIIHITAYVLHARVMRHGSRDVSPAARLHLPRYRLARTLFPKWAICRKLVDNAFSGLVSLYFIMHCADICTDALRTHLTGRD
ncbi:hypothetical protein Micbo1qcDRAFT_162260, partial [Microdochium bolleyi]